MTRTEIRAVAIAHDLAAARRTLLPNATARGFSPHTARGRRTGDASAAYYDGIAANYDRLYRDVLSQGENVSVRHRLRHMVGTGDRVLDLGCGTGLGHELLNGFGAEYVGYDNSPAMIGVARQKFGGERHATFNLADMANVAAYESERFDAVISLFGSFSHVLDPEKAVSSIRQVCRPGGRIFVMVYSRLSLRNLARCVAERSLAPVARLQHYRVRNQASGGDSAPALAYTRRELKGLFAGFDAVKVVGLNGIFELGPAKSLVRAKIRGAQGALRALNAESRLLRPFPNLCHMLVLTAIKPA